MFVGTLIGAMAYEFHATLAFRCLRLGWSSRDAATAARRGHTGSQRRWRFRACFVVAVFTLGTVNFGAQLAYVLDAFAGRGRAYAGGPAAFASATAAVPVSQISNVCCVLTVNLSDALLLWRAFVIWQRVWGVMVLPGLLYGCVACLSLFSIYGTARSDSELVQNDAVWVIYGASTIALNVLLSAMIVGRLYHISWRFSRTFGAEYGRKYTSVASIVIESALPYTVITTAFVILYNQSPDAAQSLFTIFGQIMCISPLMIIWRVACGDGFQQPHDGSRTNTIPGTDARGQCLTSIGLESQSRYDIELGDVNDRARGDTSSLTSVRIEGLLEPLTEYE